MPSLAAFPCFQLRIAEDIDMRTTPVLVGLAGIAFAAAAAQAQGLTQAWTQASPMTPQDRAIILSTARTDPRPAPGHGCQMEQPRWRAFWHDHPLEQIH